MKRDDVLAEIFAGEAQARPLAERCAAWMAALPHFAAFMEANRGKIRKKVRLAATAEGQGDLLRELEVAYLLLQHRQAALAYEAYAAEKARGPDFTLTLKGHVRCNVEVKRLRPGPRPLDARLTDAVCEKLRQMPPSLPNLLWITIEEASAPGQPASGVADTMKRLVQRADGKDEALFTRHSYRDARAFFAQYLRLSAVLAYTAGDGDGLSRSLWLDPQARHPLPPELATWLIRAATPAAVR